jgi:hypothetical protein
MMNTNPKKPKGEKKVSGGHSYSHGRDKISDAYKSTITTKGQEQQPYYGWNIRHTTPYQRINIVLVFLVFIVTATYAFFSYLQWHILRDTRDRTQRAFLFIKTFEIITCLDPDQKEKIPQQLIIRPRLMNNGMTPAMNSQITAYQQCFDYSTPNNKIIPIIPKDFEKTIVCLGPSVPVNANDIVINKQGMADIFKKTKRLFIWVSAEYNDIFPRTVLHHTSCCVEVVIFHDPTKPIMDVEHTEIARCRAFGNYDYTD